MKLAIFAAALLCGCTSIQASRNSKPANYQMVEKLEPGKTTKNDIFAVFGPPASASDQEDFEVLQYSRGDFQRLTLIINKNSEVLDHLIWIPYAEEAEAQLKNFLSKNPKMTFEEIAPQQTNPHHISTESSLIDRKSGTTLVVRNKAEIEAIIRVDMKNDGRKPATLRKNNPAHIL